MNAVSAIGPTAQRARTAARRLVQRSSTWLCNVVGRISQARVEDRRAEAKQAQRREQKMVEENGHGGRTPATTWCRKAKEKAREEVKPGGGQPLAEGLCGRMP